MVERNRGAGDNVISMRSVCKKYGDETVVRDANFDVQAGECVVLVGHNGAGKTTLVKLMLGLTRATSGNVKVLNGNPALVGASAQRKAVGYLPESVAFYPTMTGRGVLAFYASLKGVPARNCENLLQLVGLDEAANRKVCTYSKGMRQRLGLAQALLGDPRLLFLDEPTTGLDPSLRQHFYQLIDERHKQGVTSVIASHSLNEVEAKANRFIILKAGSIVACGTLEELYQQAGLPTSLRITVMPGEAVNVAERLGSKVRIGEVNNQSVNLSCFNGEKMPLIRHITALGAVVQDMQITPPRLDEVYRHFMNGEASS